MHLRQTSEHVRTFLSSWPPRLLPCYKLRDQTSWHHMSAIRRYHSDLSRFTSRT